MNETTLADIFARAEELAAEAPTLTTEQALMLRSVFARHADIEELSS